MLASELYDDNTALIWIERSSETKNKTCACKYWIKEHTSWQWIEENSPGPGTNRQMCVLVQTTENVVFIPVYDHHIFYPLTNCNQRGHIHIILVPLMLQSLFRES